MPCDVLRDEEKTILQTPPFGDGKKTPKYEACHQEEAWGNDEIERKERERVNRFGLLFLAFTMLMDFTGAIWVSRVLSVTSKKLGHT